MTDKLGQILRTRFGMSEFRKGQLSVLQSVVARRDTLAVMPTGGGKSLCYQIPSLHFDGIVVVVSPLIALMKDQVRGLKALGLAAGCLHSGQTPDEKREVFRELRTAKAFVLYLSPERVQTPGFAEWLKQQSIVLFAIDEAHCVSQWGPDFRPDYNKLGLLRQLKPEVPILALTASATPRVLADIEVQLGLKDPDRHVYGFYRPNLFYQIENCSDGTEKFNFLVEAIGKTPKGRILIYCGTRKACEEVSADLARQFSGVGYYHAGLPADERKAIQEKLDTGILRILVATNAFGMGIDYPDVRLVVHHQAPANIESLYQEMGRAGRDNAMSVCLLLYAKKDRGLHAYFINQSNATPLVVRQRWNALEALTQYVESAECRHGGILTYFRDSDRIETCGHCDVCAPQSEWLVHKPKIQPVAARIRPAPKSRSVKRPTLALETPQAEARALLLKDWRKRFAKERDVPAFIVFSDRTLNDIANKNPSSLEELEQVYGLGPAKVALFGESVLGELNGSAGNPE
jgi:ATP-dependent DNA helicase RecQ